MMSVLSFAPALMAAAFMFGAMFLKSTGPAKRKAQVV